MYIKPRKRKEKSLTTHRGAGLDYLGYLPAPTSPNEDPYWTLRIDKKQKLKKEENEKD